MKSIDSLGSIILVQSTPDRHRGPRLEHATIPYHDLRRYDGDYRSVHGVCVEDEVGSRITTLSASTEVLTAGVTLSLRFSRGGARGMRNKLSSWFGDLWDVGSRRRYMPSFVELGPGFCDIK